jgi:hypothetical protein
MGSVVAGSETSGKATVRDIGGTFPFSRAAFGRDFRGDGGRWSVDFPRDINLSISSRS